MLICEEARARGVTGAAAAILNRSGELQLTRGVMFPLGSLWRGTEKSTRATGDVTPVMSLSSSDGRFRVATGF